MAASRNGRARSQCGAPSCDSISIPSTLPIMSSGLSTSGTPNFSIALTYSGMRSGMIFDVPGQPTTTSAPSTHCSSAMSLWFSRFVNSTTCDVSKSRTPSLIMAGPLSAEQGIRPMVAAAGAGVNYLSDKGCVEGGRARESHPTPLLKELTMSSPHSEAIPAAAIAWDPRLDEIKHRLHDKLTRQLQLTEVQQLPEERRREELRRVIKRLLLDEEPPPTAAQKQQLIEELLDEILGLGPLEILLRDPSISDILVNGPHEVFVERRGRLEETAVRFRDADHLLLIIDRIVSRIGRRIDETSPRAAPRLPDGSRVNAIIPPLSLRGPALSIRRFGTTPLGLEDLLQFRAFTPEMALLLEAAIKARLNVVISGGTGSGKTTLLNTLSGFIGDGERIVTIEDAAELPLRQRHIVQRETRPASVDGKGEVSMRDLVRNALRMRPDRIVIGECRGPEALDMLQAMNSGHEGSMTTVHANSPRDALSRLETMLLMAG